ncbi:unnamed protein product [Dicrocoelium dendriticum]|nr:unnamed protein product [Dicrocoelium dendriticum]
MSLAVSVISALPGGAVPASPSASPGSLKSGGLKSSDDNLLAGSSSDEDASDEEAWAPMPVRGVLSKWTNLLHGWQERYFVLSDGTLVYFRNADEVNLGSRGSVRIRSAFVKAHEYDDCRFEVRVGEVIWYLRAVNSSQRQSWIAAIERHRIADSGYGSERTLHRPSSLVSLNSVHSPSIASSSSFKRGHGLREKLAEMETFKEILCKQVDSLQAYFDACGVVLQHSTDDRLEDWLKDGGDHTNSDELDSLDDRESVRGLHGLTQRSAGGLYSYADELLSSNSRTALADLSSTTDSDCIHRFRIEENESTKSHSPSNNQSGVTLPQSVDHPAVPIGGSSLPSRGKAYNDNQTGKTFAFPGAFLSRFLPSFRSSVAPPPTTPTNFLPSEKPPKHTDSVYEHEMQSCQNFSRFNDLRRILKQHSARAPDFRGESHMFKATAAGILTNLSHTIELMQQREDQWRKRFEREAEKRRRLEETQRAMAQELIHLRHLVGSHRSSNRSNAVSHSLVAHSYAQHYGPNRHTRLQSCGQLELRQLHSADLAIPEMKEKSTTPDSRLLFNLVGPDFEEGPNSPIREEEFYDAIDAESDKIEQDAVRLAALRSAGQLLKSVRAMPSTHPLHASVEHAVAERIRNYANSDAFLSPNLRAASRPISLQTTSTTEMTATTASAAEDWQVVTRDGDMIIYKRELETDDGVVLDPLQAVHLVHGVTAREMCSYFWDVQFRMDWEFTIDRAPTVLEVCGDDTVVLHQVYKRVWPTTQRDALFWSHIRQVGVRSSTLASDKAHHRSFSTDTCTVREPGLFESPSTDSSNNPDGVLDGWMVVNMSTDYQADKVPKTSSPMIRLGLDVVLYCQTLFDPSPPSTHSSESLPRDRLRTRLVYMANINPGGWVPAAGLRTLAAREYPRFLRRFSSYVQDQTRDTAPLF